MLGGGKGRTVNTGLPFGASPISAMRLPEESCADLGGGGGLDWPGLARAPNDTPKCFFRIIKNQGGGGGTPPPKPPPPPQTKVTIAGKNEIYNRENLVRPFLVHQVLGPKPPPPPLLKRSPAPNPPSPPPGVRWRFAPPPPPRVLLDTSASPGGGGRGSDTPRLLSNWANFSPGLRPIKKFSAAVGASTFGPKKIVRCLWRLYSWGASPSHGAGTALAPAGSPTPALHRRQGTAASSWTTRGPPSTTTPPPRPPPTSTTTA